MSNPTFASGQLTREVASTVEQFRLVAETDGKIAHNGADAFPFGVVTEKATPAPNEQVGDVSLGYPSKVRVGTVQCVTYVATDADAGSIAQGADVYAAADGKVAASGTVKVGVADRASVAGRVRVHLFHPSIFAG